MKAQHARTPCWAFTEVETDQFQSTSGTPSHTDTCAPIYLPT